QVRTVRSWQRHGGRLSAGHESPPLPAESRWSIYAEGNYASGSRNAQFYESSFDYNAGGGTVGVEYNISPDLLVGGVIAYSNPTVNLVTQQAHNDINSYQFGGYASYTSPNWFTDGLLAYGHHVYKIDRQGIIDVIHGSTMPTRLSRLRAAATYSTPVGCG